MQTDYETNNNNSNNGSRPTVGEGEKSPFNPKFIGYISSELGYIYIPTTLTLPTNYMPPNKPSRSGAEQLIKQRQKLIIKIGQDREASFKIHRETIDTQYELAEINSKIECYNHHLKHHENIEAKKNDLMRHQRQQRAELKQLESSLPSTSHYQSNHHNTHQQQLAHSHPQLLLEDRSVDDLTEKFNGL